MRDGSVSIKGTEPLRPERAGTTFGEDLVVGGAGLAVVRCPEAGWVSPDVALVTVWLLRVDRNDE